MGYKPGQYYDEWNYLIPLDIARVIFDYKLAEKAITSKLNAKKLKDTHENRENMKMQILTKARSLNFQQLVNFYQFKVKKYMGKDGYRYLGVPTLDSSDRNSIDYGNAWEVVKKAIDTTWDEGRSSASTNLPKLSKIIQDQFIADDYKIRIPRLGRGGYELEFGTFTAIPVWIDGPIFRFMFEHDEKGKTSIHFDQPPDRKHAAHLHLAVLFSEHIKTKLEGIPKDIKKQFEYGVYDQSKPGLGL